MKRTKKLIAATLCASMALSVCSCSKKFEGNVLDAADELGKNIVARNYKKIEKMASEGDEDLESLMELSSEAGEENNEALEKIASTLTYEVDEDSFEGDFMGKEGSIDVVFTYVDYEEALVDVELFEGIESFEALIDDCDDTVEVKITFEFENDGGSPVCTNIDEIEKLFPYAEEEFNFALPRTEYLGELTFLGDSYSAATNEYCDTHIISCEIPISEEGLALDWEYYYEISTGGTTYYTSSEMEPLDGKIIVDYYEMSFYIDDGEYTVTVYTADGTLLASASVTVTHTEVTPTPTPESPNSGSLYLGEDFVCPEGDSYQLPDTDLTVTLPAGFTFRDESDPYLFTILDGNYSIQRNLVVFAYNSLTGTANYIYTNYGKTYDSADDQADLQAATDMIAESMESQGYTTETYTQDVTVGDRTFTFYISESTVDGRQVYCAMGYIGDSDTCYTMVTYSHDADTMNETLNSISIP